MNERIRQLADKAGGFPLNPDCHDGEDNGYGFRERSLERLIELIVQECAEVAEVKDGAHYIGTAIKKHFGIKENT